MFIKKYKKSIGIFLAIVLALTAVMTTAFADEADDLQKQNEEMQSQIDSEKQRLEEIKGSIGNMEEYIQVLYEEVNAIQALVDEYQRLADEKRVQIAALQTEVEKQEKELEEQYRLMEQRIVFMYENGSTDMIEAFFSAGTFGEALAKVQYVMDLTEYDRNIMNEISAAIDSINTNKAVMEQELKAIEELEAEQEVQKAVMAEAAAVKEAELAEVYAEAYELQELIDTLGSEISANEERINEIIASYDQEQGITVEEYTYSGNGVFLWPLPSPYLSDHISSTFGYRYDEDVLATGASDFHSGLDIWAPEGVPILAVADGVVVADFYSGGIGNVIAIYHGDGIFTECHHMSAFGGFTTGDHVSQGDVIGYVGCTGQYSTGNHLHFGVCTGDSSWALASNYVDPLGYIG